MITVRVAKAEDVEHWRALRRDGITRYPSAFRMTLADHAAVTRETDAANLAQGNRFLCFEGDTPVGMIALYRHETPATAHRAELFGFYVIPAAHGTQAAPALIDSLLAYAGGIGVWQVELTVNEANTRAHACYLRHGFTEMGRIPNALMGADGPEHDLLMMRALTRDTASA